MSTALIINNTNTISDILSSMPFLGSEYKNIAEEISEKETVLLDELRKDLGDKLFYLLSENDKQFILATEGSVDLGYKADKNDLKRIFSSIKNDYRY